MSSILQGGSPVGQLNSALRIRTGNKDVIASGTIITADSRNLEFQLTNLCVIFEFLTDSGSTRLESGAPTSSTLNLRLYNFNNSIGAGTTQPLEIGNLGGRKLWLAFMVYALSSESSKTVHYTFMVGDPI